jgi:GNAT superfamily N-acetyltransferase
MRLTSHLESHTERFAGIACNLVCVGFGGFGVVALPELSRNTSMNPSPSEPPIPSTSDLRTEGTQDGWQAMLRGSDRVLVRPIHAQDVELARRFIEGLSPTSRRFRFLETMRSPSDALLSQLTTIDPSTDAAYVAVIGKGAEERQIGVARFSAKADGDDCEFAVTVSDEWQNKGLGTLLMRHLIEAARSRGIESMHSSDPADNRLMRRFAKHLRLRHMNDPQDSSMVRYIVDIKAI